MHWLLVLRSLAKGIYKRIKFKEMKRNEIEKEAGRIVAVVVAVMAISLVVFFVFGNNVLTVL